jgi:hypothetical protein
MNYKMIAVDVSLTLMVLDQNGDFAPSTVMIFPYFVFAPETFEADLTGNILNLMHQIYNEHYHAFKLREPNDPNYIAVVKVEPRILSHAENLEKPWLKGHAPMWESSNCILISNQTYQKIDPNKFGELLGLA